MLRSKRILFALLFVGTVVATNATAAEPDLAEDGWYRWEVPAGPGGLRACCHEILGGTVRRVACTLGEGMNEFSAQNDCERRSDTMQIFVEVRDGEAREIRPLSNACPVRSDAPVHTIENVSTAESIAWLRRQVDDNPRVSDEAIMTLSFHADGASLGALFEILEDTRQRHEAREQALFWLVQSNSDEAYAYLDRLLD